MAVLRFAGFAGENRAVEPKLLADPVCTVSRNQKPGRGDLRSWKVPSTVATLTSTAQTIYRMGRDVASDSQYWLSWPTAVKAVRGFSSDDTSEQTFFTGDGAPQFTNNVLGIASAPYPTASRPMGLPAPLTAPTATNIAAVVVDEGKYELLIADSYISRIEDDSVFAISVDDGEDQLFTVTTVPVTATALRDLIAANVTGVVATVQTQDEEQVGGVRLVSSTVGKNFVVKYKIGETTSYDAADVTYTAFKTNTAPTEVAATDITYSDLVYKIKTVGTTIWKNAGAASNTVGVTFTSNGTALTGTGTAYASAYFVLSPTEISNIAVNQRLRVKIDSEPPVSTIVSAGVATFPTAVTAETVRNALAAVGGVRATIIINSDNSRSVLVQTENAASGTKLVLDKINGETVNNFSTVGTGTEIKQDDSVTNSVYYVYTYVNDLGWESAPSPVSEENIRYAEIQANLAGFATPPAGNYNINTIRIYKTQTGTGATNFYFLREASVGTALVLDDNRDLGELLETTTWLPAPGVPTGGSLDTTEDNLQELTAMWNGMMAGITGNAVRICESYVPYAWPKAFEVLPPDSTPVGLGVFGQNLLVLTTGRPLLVMGSSPEGLDQVKVEMPQACVAPRSIVSMGAGVAWASEDGLCWFGSGGPRILTGGIMLREDWQKLNPASIIGCMYEGLYFGSYDDGTGRKGFFIDPGSPQGIYFMDTGYEAVHFDELRDQLYVLDGTSIKKWDAGTTPMTYLAKSKVYKQPYPVNYGAAEVIASQYPVTFKLYADGVLKHTQTVTSRAPFRLPGGFRAFDYQIELEGTNAIQGVGVASTMQELSAV